MEARVIHIITKLELGGAQQNTLYTVGHLDRSRFSVALWSGEGGILNDDARAITDLDFELIPELAREVDPWKDLNALWQLRQMLADEVRFSEAPVIVHTHSSKAGILGRLAAGMARAPIVIHTFHGFGFNDFQSWPTRRAFIMAEKLASFCADYFVAVSKANLEKAVALGLSGPDRIRVIRSGIKISEFERAPGESSAARKEQLGFDPSRPLALMAACLKPQKKPTDFVEVAKRVADRVPGAQFALAGDGALRGEVERAAAASGLGNDFRLLGWRRDMPELMWSADVLVLTSLWEGLPRVYPQAMAAGLPIVGTRVDGAGEAVEDGVNGWLVEPGDVDGLAAYVVELLRDPKTAASFGAAGKRMVDEFDIDLMVRQQEELYAEALRKLKNP